ncbi:unnamed protein product [Pylaiella littoralis]
MGSCMSTKRGKNASIDSVRSHLVRERKDGAKVEDLYETISTIGRGSVGMISKVRHRQTGVEYALKTIQLDKISSSLAKEMRNEIEILKRLDHPNIIRAIETFEANKEVYLVMKLCTGGDLRSRAPYTERAVVDIIAKLLSATWYMHQEGVVHRDLKLENVVYESKLPDSDIYIIDYGLSKIVDTHEARMKEVVGTLYTMAPEVLDGGKSYDKSCDMWSIGVMTFVLLSGDMPFDHSSKQRLINAVEDGRFEFSGKRWDRVSGDARNFIRRMMVKDPSGRYTAGQALQHGWINQFRRSGAERLMSSPAVLDKADHDRVVASLKNFASYSKVKRTALMLVAYRSHPDETKAMRDAFKAYDVDLNGRVSREEFQNVLKKQGYTNAELVGLFDEVDDDHDGYLHYTEFLAATLETDGKEVTDERLAEAFHQLDMDDSGSISRDNLVEFLGKDSKVRRLRVAVHGASGLVSPRCRVGMIPPLRLAGTRMENLAAPPLNVTHCCFLLDCAKQLAQQIVAPREMAPIAFPSSLLPNSCRPYYMICIDDLFAVKLVSCFPRLFISKESHVFTSAATLLHPYLRPISLSRGVCGCPFRLLWLCDRLPAECIGNAVCAFRLDGSISIDRTTSKGYDVTRLIAEADEDGNGAINLQEFCKHMRKSGRFGIPGFGSTSTSGGTNGDLPREENAESAVSGVEQRGENLPPAGAEPAAETSLPTAPPTYSESMAVAPPLAPA